MKNQILWKDAILSMLMFDFTRLAAASLRRNDYLSPFGNFVGRQKNEVCQASFADGGLVYIKEEYAYVSPSFFEICMESFSLDVENILHHIYNLNGIFSQFHCFYHLAKDPSDSQPIGYQPQHGYTLFGEGEGKVDVAQRIKELTTDLQSNQLANVTTFWTLNEVFQDLRDGHVQVPPVTGEVFVTWLLRIFPERTIQGGDNVLAKPEFSLLPNGDIVLKIIWLDAKSEKETESVVKTIDGQSVSRFIERLASSSALQFTFQSLGARVNAFFEAAAAPGYQPYLFPLAFNTNPRDVLPDRFTVRYADGTKETFVTGILNPGILGAMNVSEVDPDVYVLQNRSLVEGFINRPGLAYQYYSEARGQIVDAVTELETFDGLYGGISKKSLLPALGDEQKPAKQTLAIQTRSADKGADAFDFDHVWSRDSVRLGEDGEPIVVTENLMGYKIEKDYAVLKIGTWMVDPVLFRTEVWSNITAAAKEKGVTKLVVDIAGNGGGFGANAAVLAVSMFPHVDYQWYSDNLDQTYNDPMQDYVDIVTPMIKQFENMTDSWTDEDVVSYIRGLSQQQVEALDLTARSLEKFCALNNREQGFCSPGPNCEPSCNLEQVKRLATEVDNFLRYPTPPAYLDVWDAILGVAKDLSAWTITLGGTLSKLKGETDKTTSVVRGGVEYNVTKRGSLLWYSDYNEAARRALQAQHIFDEYVIVSDGTAASASSIFVSLVGQIWKNRDRSKATSRVTTVAYGGTGKLSDLTMASIPAAVENVRLDNSFYTTFSLLMLPMILPYSADTEEMHETLVRTVDYLDSRSFRPSFFAQSLPVMPVQNYYDKLMGPDALPLQYIKMQPDGYIRKILTGTTFEKEYDLSTLYDFAFQFFLQQTDDESILFDGIQEVSVGKRSATKKIATPEHLKSAGHEGNTELKGSTVGGPSGGSIASYMPMTTLSLVAATTFHFF